MGAEVVAAGRLKLGDRVAGGADGMEAFRPQSGAFAEYASVDGIMVFKLPEDMSFEVGAGMPLRIATSAMALFHSLQLPSSLLKKPAEEPFDVLVYGGATSTGTMAIQILKKCGLRVITTCSPRNFDLVRSYGADVCFDYNTSTCGPDIRAFTKNALDYALDCITEESTMKICYQALGRCGGKCKSPHFLLLPFSGPPHLLYLSPTTHTTPNQKTPADVGLEPYPAETATRRAVQPDWILATWMRGLPISWPEPFGTANGKPECHDFALTFFPHIYPLFEAGELKSHPIRSEADGFEGLLDGVALLRKGKVSGQKLVYRTADRRGVVVAAAA